MNRISRKSPEHDPVPVWDGPSGETEGVPASGHPHTPACGSYPGAGPSNPAPLTEINKLLDKIRLHKPLWMNSPHHKICNQCHWIFGSLKDHLKLL